MLRSPRHLALVVGTVLGLIAVVLFLPEDGGSGDVLFLVALFALSLAPFALLSVWGRALGDGAANGLLVVLAGLSVVLFVVILLSGDPFTLVLLFVLPFLQLGLVLAARLMARLTRPAGS